MTDERWLCYRVTFRERKTGHETVVRAYGMLPKYAEEKARAEFDMRIFKLVSVELEGL